jgi:hypothetical protein
MNNTNHGGNAGDAKKLNKGHVKPLWLFLPGK